MFQPLIEVAFLLVYAALLAAVTPYITGGSENYGSLIPGAAAMASGSVIWSLLTWVGLPDNEGWIWVITMVLMPVAMAFAVKYFGKFRAAGKLAFVDSVAGALKNSDEAPEDLVTLSA